MANNPYKYNTGLKLLESQLGRTQSWWIDEKGEGQNFVAITQLSRNKVNERIGNSFGFRGRREKRERDALPYHMNIFSCSVGNGRVVVASVGEYISKRIRHTPWPNVSRR